MVKAGRVVVVALGYFAVAKLGIELDVAAGVVTPVWAATGLSLAALLLLGYGVWPGIAAGAFAANVTSEVTVATAAAISVGNTLEGVAGKWLLERVRGFRPSLSRGRDVVAFVAAGAIASPIVAASVGSTALLLSDEISRSDYRSTWFLWWFGDAVGALIVAPLLLTWLVPPRRPVDRNRAVEGVVLLAVLVAVAFGVFSGDRWQYPYVIFPLLVWTALRFDVRGAATANFLVTAIAVWATVDGAVLIEGATARETVQILQALIGVVGVSLLTVAATIAERTAAEEAMAGSVSLLASTLDATADGVLVVDLEGRMVSYNRQFVEMWRIPSEVADARDDELAQRYVLDQLADPPAFRARIAELYARPHEESTDVLLFRDGRVVERFSRPHQLGDRVIGRVWSFRDVTEARRAEVLKGRFLDMAGHEMKNPLGVVSALAGVLIDDWETLGDPSKLEYLQRIRDRADDMAVLVDGLLLASRAESGRLEPRVRTVELVGQLREIVDDDHAVSVTTDARVLALADPDYLRTMVVNYVTNADKYGRPPVTVAVRAVDSHVEVCVCDGGSGVPPELAAELFERFSPARAALNPRAPGTGLGLWIVRELARAQGGDAWYDGDSGSRFCFRLPAAD